MARFPSLQSWCWQQGLWGWKHVSAFFLHQPFLLANDGFVVVCVSQLQLALPLHHSMLWFFVYTPPFTKHDESREGLVHLPL